MDCNHLLISSFNCRSVTSSVTEIVELCEQNDFVLLQEYWLLPDEISYLNNLHKDFLTFLSTAKSAVDVSKIYLLACHMEA